MKIIIEIPEEMHERIKDGYVPLGISKYLKNGTPYEERPHGEWIPCSERLPEQCENVLAWIERDAWIDGSDYPKRKQEAAIGFHVGGLWCFDGYAGSTTKCLAWMPLPKPYEEEGEN